MERFDWLNSSDAPFQSFQQQKKSGRGYRQAHSVAKMPDHNVSALQLHLLGMTKRSFYTRKNVMEFLQHTEQKAKEKARRAVEEYITASKQNSVLNESSILQQSIVDSVDYATSQPKVSLRKLRTNRVTNEILASGSYGIKHLSKLAEHYNSSQ